MILFTGTDPIVEIFSSITSKCNKKPPKLASPSNIPLAKKPVESSKELRRLISFGVRRSDWLSGDMWCNGFLGIDLFLIYVSEKRKINFKVNFFLELNSDFWVRGLHRMRESINQWSSNCVQNPPEMKDVLTPCWHAHVLLLLLKREKELWKIIWRIRTNILDVL